MKATQQQIQLKFPNNMREQIIDGSINITVRKTSELPCELKKSHIIEAVFEDNSSPIFLNVAKKPTNFDHYRRTHPLNDRFAQRCGFPNIANWSTWVNFYMSPREPLTVIEFKKQKERNS